MQTNNMHNEEHPERVLLWMAGALFLLALVLTVGGRFPVSTELANRTSALLDGCIARSKITLADVQAIAVAAYHDGAENALLSMREAVSEANVGAILKEGEPGMDEADLSEVMGAALLLLRILVEETLAAVKS